MFQLGVALQGTALFVVSLFQYISLMLVFSKAHPYRRSILSNTPLSLSCLVCLAASVWLSLEPPDFFRTNMSMRLAPPMLFRLFLVMLGVWHLLTALFLENCCLDPTEALYRRLKQRWRPGKPVKYVEMTARAGRHPLDLFGSA